MEITMNTMLNGDKDQADEKTAPAERSAPQRDGQGGSDTIPTRRSSPAKDDPQK